ncbi:MAG: hypothetical protein LZF62_480187 [Nitrospira sp.]|nr:MAG: hypothetical protein LZF62_480187 [Nitrospira sp.]
MEEGRLPERGGTSVGRSGAHCRQQTLEAKDEQVTFGTGSILYGPDAGINSDHIFLDGL